MILFSIDYQTIWVESDGEILSHFRSIFKQSLEEARPLANRFYDFMEMAGYFRSLGLGSGSFISIEHMPSGLLLCMKDILSQEMLLPKGRAARILTAFEEWRTHFQTISKTIAVFNSDSLNQFALTGVLSTMPGSFVRPLTVRERGIYLENLESIALQDGVTVRAVLSSRMPLSPGLTITIHENSGISFGFLDAKKESWYYISITENTIVDSFRDFIDNSLENLFFLSQEDTLELIRQARRLLSETV
ncbi:hypothetical protein DXA13_00775 [Clostridium sp. AM58-1XD]|nr:hypothetical protein DXA13_00775 [Clostridium sp. AM58-1XD]